MPDWTAFDVQAKRKQRKAQAGPSALAGEMGQLTGACQCAAATTTAPTTTTTITTAAGATAIASERT